MHLSPVKILLTAATEAEIAPTIGAFSTHPNISVCITGVGICAATFALTRALLSDSKPDLVLAAGIAGSFDRNLPLGTVSVIVRDTFGDLGAEDHDSFLSLPQMNLATENEVIFENEVPSFLAEITARLPKKEAITVHTATGTAHTATQRFVRFGPVLESMEGAAFHYICQQLSVPLLHLRAVSNYAEARNRPAWNIGLAVKNLNEVLGEVIG